MPHVQRFRIPYVDAKALIEATPEFWEYPMCDRDPLPRWTHGRVTLLGDAAHPMYPVGSNGASQAILDARCLADRLVSAEHPVHALWQYEQERLPPTAQIVKMNRGGGPEGVIDAVEQRAPDGFSNIDDVLPFEQRKAIVRGYAGAAGFAQSQVNKARQGGVNVRRLADQPPSHQARGCPPISCLDRLRRSHHQCGQRRAPARSRSPMFDFNRVVDRRGTHASKWDNMARLSGIKAPDAIPMWVADMDFTAPPGVTAALTAEIERATHGYYADTGSWAAALADWMMRRHGLRVDPAWVSPTPGIVSGLGLILQAVSAPGDEVVVFPPAYHAFRKIIVANERRILDAQLVETAGRYAMDLTALREQADAPNQGCLPVQSAQSRRHGLVGG